MKPKPKKEFLSRRRWKHCVQALSCLVVFCTVYMLILPVITLEAKSYCGKEEHSHSPDCFIEIDQCGLIEHEHDKFCYDDEGSLICSLDEHVHDASCSDRILECGKTEHKHELICFSNPEADLDKPENWEKKIDEIKTDNPDFTKRQLITAIAKSQEGQKESLDNYKVQDETVKKGISRYGIWDDDPYEDWSGAFARFVLSYSGFEDELTTYPKDLDEWLEQLNKEEKLLPVLDGKQGDVLFAYTEQDELKAGIITDNNDERITAIMGDWQDKVSRQTFQIDDSNLHSIFKITPDDPDKDQKDSEDKNSSDDQFDNSDQASDPDQNEDQSSSSEDSNDNPAGPADFTESNGKFNSSFNDTSDEDTSKDDDNKTSQSNENSNDPDGKESDEKDVTDGLKDKSEDSSDSTSKEGSDKSDKSDSADDSSSSEKDSSENSSENSKTDADSEDPSGDTSEDEKNGDDADDSQTGEDGEDSSQSEDELKDQDGQENADEAETYTKEATAEDGTVIKASWPAGAFEDDSNIRLQVKAEELTETQRKQIESHLDKDKSYSFKTYDITFSSVNDEMELEKVEPLKPVHIKITYNGLAEDPADLRPNGLFHIEDKGNVEYIPAPIQAEQDKSESDNEINSKKPENENIELISQDGERTEFRSQNFSKYVVALESISDWQDCENMHQIIQHVNNNKRHIRLKNSIWNDTQTIEIHSGNSSSNDPVIIDTKGYGIQSDKIVLKIYTGGHCVLTNSNPTSSSSISDKAGWNGDDGGKCSVVYGPETGNLRTKVGGVGVIQSKTSNTIEIYNDGSQLQIEKGVAVISPTQRAIYASEGNAKIYLDQAYILHSKGGIALHYGPTLIAGNGAVISNNTADTGGGIYADSLKINGTSRSHSRTTVVLNDGCLVANNSATIGGGVNIGDDGEFSHYAGSIEEHSEEAQRIIANVATTECPTLIMNGGIIENNTATSREGGGIALRFNSSARAVLYGGEIRNNKTTAHNDWGGGGVFASQGSFLWMPNGADVFSNTSTGLGGGLTGCATGKLQIDDSLNIYGNTAVGDLEHGLSSDGSSKHKDHERLLDEASIYQAGEHWKGQDVFGAMQTQMTGPGYANYQGIVDGSQVSVPGGTTVKASDWLVLDNMQQKNLGKSLQIHGNSSGTHGGGILINGWLVTGETETQVVGDDLAIHASKSFLTQTGKVVTEQLANPFRFLISTNEQFSEVVSSGTVNGAGQIEFDKPLTVIPEGVNDNQTNASAVYFLAEDKTGLPDSIIPSNWIYKLEIDLDRTSTTSIQVPEWDSTSETFKSKTIQIWQYSIKSVSVSRKDSANSTDYAFLQTFNGFSEQGTKSIDLTSMNGSLGTFANYLIQKKKITVKKQWEDADQIDHSADTVTVLLKRRMQNQTDDQAQALKAVTLNSDDFIENGALVPDNVTKEAAGKGVWEYTWPDLNVSENNQEWVYLVEEYCSNHLYSGLITSSFDIDNNEAISSSQEVDAWVPAQSFVRDKEYLIVDPQSNIALSFKNYSSNVGYWITGNDKDHLTEQTNMNGIKAYKLDSSSDSNRIVKNSEFNTGGKDNGLVNISKSCWLWHNIDSNAQGLMASVADSYKNSTTKGFMLRGENLIVQYQEGTAVKLNTVIYDPVNNTFGTANRAQNGARPARLYEKGKVRVANDDVDVNINISQNFTITNKKKTDLSFSLNVIKTDKDNPNLKLSGAKFELLKNEKAVSFTSSSNGQYSYSESDSVTDLVSNENGEIHLTNLPEGTYVLEEIAAPDGYTLPEKLEDRQWNIDLTAGNTELNLSDLSISQTVPNEMKTYELPETGGPGTGILKMTGSVLISGASIAITQIYRKKRNDKTGKAGEN